MSRICFSTSPDSLIRSRSVLPFSSPNEYRQVEAMTAAMANTLSVRFMFPPDGLMWYGFARVSARRTRSSLYKRAFSLLATGKVARDPNSSRLPVVFEPHPRTKGKRRRSAAHLVVLHSLFFLETLVQFSFLLLAHTLQFFPLCLS